MSAVRPQVFTLRFRFSDKYPMESPEVVFTGVPPEHPHIYSNGHICLSILCARVLIGRL